MSDVLENIRLRKIDRFCNTLQGPFLAMNGPDSP